MTLPASMTLLPLAPILSVLLVPFVASGAQPPRQPNAAELERALRRLNVVGSVLYIAAHPDDENTRLLSYLANEKLLRTGYLSVTRGDGGQNLIGSEQGPLLGLIRTQELLAARRVDGAEQFFTRARDFGYSKTPEETLAIWGNDNVLADMVWVIRRFQPDVLITRFPTHGFETHGHHTASARLAEEAFRAAADPAYHPEQLKYVGTWQAKRLLWNRSVWNSKPTDDLSKFLKLDVGGYNPLLGISYGEMAADSRSNHKSQGFGAARSRGTTLEYFETLAGDPPKQTILDGIDLTWKRVPGSDKLAALLARAAAEFNLNAPHATLPTLLDAHGQIEALPSGYWKTQKKQELLEVITAAAGLHAEVYASDFLAVPGGELGVTAVAINRSPSPFQLEEIRLPGGITLPIGKALAYDEPVQAEKTLLVPAGEASTNPCWLNEPPEKGLYHVSDALLVGLPEQPPSLQAELVVSSGGHKLLLRRPIAYKWTDPVAGERYRPLEIAPPVMVNPGSSVLMFPDLRPRELKVVVKAGKANARGVLRLALPEGWKAEPASLPFQLDAKGAEAELDFTVRPPPTTTATSPTGGTLTAIAEIEGQKVQKGVTRIEYPHIPIQTLFPDATVKLVRLDLKKTGSKLGYIAGAGDEVPAALRQVGYEVTSLGDEALRGPSLAKYDAIVVGVRAYNTNPRMQFYYRRLMEYVAAGGTLVVQYNTKNWISKIQSDIGPFPFEISQERVTDENAAVTFASPRHAVLDHPNKIGPADFEGWVQERGLYFAGKWDGKYETPLAMNDAGESPQKGSLLVVKHGKGTFIYTGLAFFRQLPAGVPGAYRLFANLIAHGK